MEIINRFKIIFLFVLTTTLVLSCKKTYHPRLLELVDVLSNNPDSIYNLLDTMIITNYDFSENDKMYYLLLKASAQNKAFIPFTAKDDSIYSPAVKYFLEQGDSYLRMQACYVMGSIYRDLNCRIAAQEWYNKAISMSNTLEGQNI